MTKGFALMALMVLFGATLAHAQVPSGADITRQILQSTNAIADQVLQHDESAFHLFNLDSFKLVFHQHRRVCDEVLPGEAHCDARVTTNERGTPLASPKAMSGYGSAQFLSAYNLSGQASGNPIIAIVDAYDDPNIQKDLDTYSTAFGIPKLPACAVAIANSPVACFQKVNQSGTTRSYPRVNAGWALEIALDVEVAHAVCQNCSILLVEASSNSYGNLMAAVDRAVLLGAKVVSNSWGSNEFSGETSYDSHFNRPGVAFTVSSGDSGYGVEYPAASRYVTAVGGTTLLFNTDGSYNKELAWSGAGSGCSAFEQKPAWQSDTLCARRTVADVSAVADPNTGAAVYNTVRYAGMSGWFQVGGTSLAAPIVAAVYALSGNTSGNANQIPYTLGNVAANLHDIVGGSNGSCSGSYLCTALAGFDGPTGLGTPNGATAF